MYSFVQPAQRWSRCSSAQIKQFAQIAHAAGFGASKLHICSICLSSSGFACFVLNWQWSISLPAACPLLINPWHNIKDLSSRVSILCQKGKKTTTFPSTSLLKVTEENNSIVINNSNQDLFCSLLSGPAMELANLNVAGGAEFGPWLPFSLLLLPRAEATCCLWNQVTTGSSSGLS